MHDDISGARLFDGARAPKVVPLPNAAAELLLLAGAS
jgi:hypothetical protein